MKVFNLPDLGEGLAEAEIVRWHITPGDRVAADQPMVAVETAKAIVEVPSPWNGVIKAIHGKPGDVVETGALLVEFEGEAGRGDSGTVVGTMPSGDADFPDTQTSERSSSRRGNGATHPRAVPAARALAKKLGIELAHVPGTGRGELITVDDVLDASASPAGLTTRPVSPEPPRDWISTPGETEKLRGPRRAMAQSMAVSRDSVMACTLFDDADLHGWQPEQDITTRLLRAIAAGCTAERALNAWFDSASLTRRLLDRVNVAIAVDTGDGLIVPVIRDVGRRPVADLRQDVDRLKRNTRARSVAPEELRDFTFMLSNFGMIAGRYATPVVVPPAVAILGSGRLAHDVVAVEGGVEAHLRVPLSLTFDHRCVTGGEAARFMAALLRDLRKGN